MATPFRGWDAHRQAQHLDEVGIRAPARVLDANNGRWDAWEELEVELEAAGERIMTTVTGEAFEFYERGRVVDVEYDPAEPSRARLLGSNSDLWSRIMPGIIVGTIALLVAVPWAGYLLLNRLKPLTGRRVRRDG